MRGLKQWILRHRIVSGAFIFLVIWLVLNPPLRFGIATTFGITTYSGVPIPYCDLVIHSNGLPTIRKKSHLITESEIKMLIDEHPEVIIVGNGYNGAASVDPEGIKLAEQNGITVKILLTPEACKHYNELAWQGIRVAAIIHSTC